MHQGVAGLIPWLGRVLEATDRCLSTSSPCPHHQSPCKPYPQVRVGWLVGFWKANSVQVTSKILRIIGSYVVAIGGNTLMSKLDFRVLTPATLI